MLVEDVVPASDNPEFQFLVCVGEEPRSQVFGPADKRNWVLWKLSEYVLALSSEGAVSVKRMINGEWSPCDDWRKLAH